MRTSIRWTDQDIEELKSMVSSGIKRADMPEKLNRSIFSIEHKIKKLNLSGEKTRVYFPLKPMNDNDKAELIKMHALGVSFTEIGKALETIERKSK